MNDANRKKRFVKKLSDLCAAVRSRQLFSAFQWRLAKLGLELVPYYLIREGLSLAPQMSLCDESEDYSFESLAAKDMEEVAGLEYSFSEEALNKMLQKSRRCFGIRHRNEIVAVLWCDLIECHHEPYSFSLRKNEAYLYAMTTSPSFRGKGLAAVLRWECYRALAHDGIDTLYSVSEYLNTPAIRLKEKMNAEFLKLLIYVCLWKKFRWNWVLRNYYPSFNR